MTDERNDEGMELNDEQLDEVSGGFLYFNGDAWEIIDNKGGVVKTLPHGTDWMLAVTFSEAMGYRDTREIDSRTLQRIRESGGFNNLEEIIFG